MWSSRHLKLAHQRDPSPLPPRRRRSPSRPPHRSGQGGAQLVLCVFALAVIFYFQSGVSGAGELLQRFLFRGDAVQSKAPAQRAPQRSPAAPAPAQRVSQPREPAVVHIQFSPEREPEGESSHAETEESGSDQRAP